jgi:hypothetical protein
MKPISLNYFIKLITYLVTRKLTFLINCKTKRKVINGITYELDLTELIDRNLYYFGCWERKVIQKLKNILSPI